MPPVPQPEERHVYRPPSPPRWKGRDSLDLVYQLNERCLHLLRGMAASADTSEWLPIAHHRELWSTLNADAVKRAARIPFVILDVHFTNEKWWREVIEGSNVSAKRELPAHEWGIHGWPANVAGELIQEALIFAWHTAKWDRRVARLSLGMLPAVAELIAALTPRQLATISENHSGALRLRWRDHPDFWTRLLLAARGGDEGALTEIHLHAKLLLCGEILTESE